MFHSNNVKKKLLWGENLCYAMGMKETIRIGWVSGMEVIGNTYYYYVVHFLGIHTS